MSRPPGGRSASKSAGRSPFPLFRPNKDGSPWFVRAFRITTTRIISQTVFFSLFVFLLWVTWFSRLGGYPVSLFLEVDPLVSLATAIATHTIYRGHWMSLWVLIPTLLLGRVFCNWMCPYGSLHQFTGWLFNRRTVVEQIDSNRYRHLFSLKYYILFWMLAMAVFGSLQVGLLDPICLLFRSFTVAVLPSHSSTACDSPTFMSTTRTSGVSVASGGPPESISG